MWSKSLRLESDGNDVCSLIRLVGFDERRPLASQFSLGGSKDDHAKDQEEFNEHLRFVIKNWDKQYVSCAGKNLWTDKSVHRTALIQAVTTDVQPFAEKYLKELGFKSSKHVSKLKHPLTKLRLWYIPSRELLDNLGMDYPEKGVLPPQVKKRKKKCAA